MTTRIPVTLERVRLPATYEESREYRPYGFGAYGWRSVLKIIVAGELVGFLTMGTGWGKRWEIYGLEAPITFGVERGTHELTVVKTDKVAEHKSYRRDENGNRVPYGAPLYAGSASVATEPKYAMSCKYFSSKESALDEVPDMLEDGYLRPESVVLAEAKAKYAETVAERERMAEMRAQYDRERAEIIAQKEADLDHVTAAFVEMLTERNISDYQREALFLAAKHLGITGLDMVI